MSLSIELSICAFNIIKNLKRINIFEKFFKLISLTFEHV